MTSRGPASSQARGPVDLAWLFGGLSTATVRLVGRPGTARLAQRPDCLAECETEYQLLMACGPDELEVGLAGSISTADGLLSREHIDGHAFGRQTDRGLEWRGYAAVQGSTLNGTLDPLAHTDYADARDPRVLLWLYGVGEELSGIDVGLQITRTVAGEDAEVHSSLGGTP